MGRALLVMETDIDRQTAKRWIEKAPVGTRVEFKASKRSLPQNDMMWALLTEVSQQLEHGGKKYDPTQWKAIFLHAFGREISFLPSLDMKTFLPIELSSSDLSKDEMTNLIEFIIKEGAERGVVFKEPKSDASSSTSDSDDRPEGSSQEAAQPANPVAASTNSNAEVNPASATGEPEEPPTAGSPEQFTFDSIELQHLKDFARKALDDAISGSLAALIEDNIERMRANYYDAIESKDGRAAMEAMRVPIVAVIAGKRTREQASAYIARDLLGCDPEELRSIRNG